MRAKRRKADRLLDPLEFSVGTNALCLACYSPRPRLREVRTSKFCTTFLDWNLNSNYLVREIVERGGATVKGMSALVGYDSSDDEDLQFHPGAMIEVCG